MPAIGEIIARLRARKGWSQGQLTLKTSNKRGPGVSKGAISLLESGQRKNPHILTIAKLASALDASVDDILIAAELLPARTQIESLSLQERELIEALRAISSPAERQEILDHVIGLVKFSASVDRIVHDRLRLVAEEAEEYERKED